jgi:hypothetical protein
MTEPKIATSGIFCVWCKRITAHILRAQDCRPRLVREGEVEEGGQPGDIITCIWTCAGCDATTFEQRIIMLEDGDLGPCYFPTKAEDSLVESSDPPIPKKHFRQLNSDLTRLYEEIIKSFNDDCLVLCTMGLRALTEGFCKDKGIKGKNLEEKINGLARLVPNLNIIDALHAFRFVGNDAAHDLAALSRENAKVAIDFMESFLSSQYELDEKAQEVRNISPKAAFKRMRPNSVQ